MGIATFTHELETKVKQFGVLLESLPKDSEDAAVILGALLADYQQIKALVEGGNLVAVYQDVIADIAALKSDVLQIKTDFTAGIAAATAAGATTAPTAAAQANIAATKPAATTEVVVDAANHGSAV